MAKLSPVAELGALLEPGEARRLVACLEQDPRLHVAIDEIRPARRSSIELALEAALAHLASSVPRLIDVIDGICGAGMRKPPRLDPVWSGPDLVGAEGRTTRAVAGLVDSATDRVHATTYSAGLGSPYIQALRKAIMRGVGVTVVVDTADMAPTAAQLLGHLSGAKFWTPAPGTNGVPLQHSKLVLIDDRAGLVTSANMSTAAADRNLECGLLTEDPVVVTQMRRHLDDLYAAGHLVDYEGGNHG